MVAEQGAEDRLNFTPRIFQPDTVLIRAAIGASDDTVAYLIDSMTGLQIREARARLAAEKVRLEQMANVMQGTLSLITDALRARV